MQTSNKLDEEEAVALLEREHLASVAAAAGSRIDNAVVCVAHDGLNLYFGGFTDTLKGRLMGERNQVALTLGALQYHGKVRVLAQGSPAYHQARAVYDARFPGYAFLFDRPGNELYEVIPQVLWLYEEARGVFERRVLVKDEAYYRGLMAPEPTQPGEEIDFTALEAETLAFVRSCPVAVLATEGLGRVSARSMSLVWSGLEAWFQASALSDKVAQITQNPRVALCHGNLQYEGLAEVRGNAFLPENHWFLDQYSAAHPGSFARYGRLPEERVIRIVPTRIVFWKYVEGRPYREGLDLVTRKAWREPMPESPASEA